MVNLTELHSYFVILGYRKSNYCVFDMTAYVSNVPTKAISQIELSWYYSNLYGVRLSKPTLFAVGCQGHLGLATLIGKVVSYFGIHMPDFPLIRRLPFLVILLYRLLL